MKQRQNLSLKQKPALNVFNEVRLYLDLLPLTSLELREKIEEVIEQNPALEIEYGEQLPREEEEVPSSWEGEEFFEFSYYDGEEKDPPEALIPYIPDQRERIRKAFLPHFQDKEERKIAEALIDYLDSKGFLDEASLALVSEETGRNGEFVEKIRKKLLSIPPFGIGAKDIVEGFKAQLRGKNKEGSLSWKILDNGILKLLEKRDYEIVAEKLCCNLKQLKEAIAEISKLNIFPASIFNERTADQIDVDIILEDNDGELKVKVIERDLPPIRINPLFLRILDNPDSPPEIVKFAREKIRIAKWFLDAISKRRETLKKTVEYIVDRQREFFEKGYKPERLKPLNLKEVASAVGVHESTISRIISTRFISTPKGTYRLKYFFPSRIGIFRGDISSVSIKERIKKLIEREPRDEPYSDEDINAMLAKKGIYISRRTVAKYREEMGIESANKREKKYRLEVST